MIIVVYSKQLIAAARVWWILMYAGAADVRILDGDSRNWEDAGFQLEKTVNQFIPAEFNVSQRYEWIIETEQILQFLYKGKDNDSDSNYYSEASHRDPNLRLFDTRSLPEYDGKISGYSYLDAKGRIPNAIWLGDADDSSQIYKLSNGRLRDPFDVL